MFLSREYRARAIGLAAAYAVVIAGLIIGAALEPSPAKDVSEAAHSTAGSAQPKSADDFSPTSDIDSRCDPVC